MKITEIETFLMDAVPAEAGGWNARIWLSVRVRTESGIYGVVERQRHQTAGISIGQIY